MDVSKKNGLTFRLLHAVVKGHPWYGEWGYQFGSGCFSLTFEDYKSAIKNLSSLPVSTFQSQGRISQNQLQDLISFYQSISEHELATVRDLFCFLMSLINNGHHSTRKVNDSPHKKLRYSGTNVLCSWTTDDIKHVEEAMLKVLSAVRGPAWVSWRALKGAVCKVGPPELLNYCLKELNGKLAAPGMVVQARSASCSGAMEYRIEPGNAELGRKISLDSFPITNYLSEERLLLDLQYLYECMLHPATMVKYVSPYKRNIAISSATKILDCKKFIKDYHPNDVRYVMEQDIMHLLCEVDLKNGLDICDTNPPPELLVLSPDATIVDLKVEATRAFQDVYLMFKSFQVNDLVEYDGFDESTQIKFLPASNEIVQIQGQFIGENDFTKFRMEKGIEKWTMDCSCGAKDDDGERMLACDVCGIWKHTRCTGIPDCAAVPRNFYCYECMKLFVQVTNEKTKSTDIAFNVDAGSSCTTSLTSNGVL